MVILGIDPGFSSLGWSLLDLSKGQPRCLDAGVIRTKPDRKLKRCDDNARRIAVITKRLEQLHRHHQPIIIAAEAQSWTSFVNADRSVAMAWGCLSALGEIWALPIIQFRPQEIKKAVCGDASASKQTLENALVDSIADSFKHLAKISKTQRNHAADALGAAVTSLDHDIVRMMVNVRNRGQA
jgi:Holliday junction resolvasome RuvABC endonuclease subunit